MHPDHWPKRGWAKGGPDGSSPHVRNNFYNLGSLKNLCQAIFSSNQLKSNSKKVLQSRVSSSFKLLLLVINKETTTEEEPGLCFPEPFCTPAHSFGLTPPMGRPETLG